MKHLLSSIFIFKIFLVSTVLADDIQELLCSSRNGYLANDIGTSACTGHNRQLVDLSFVYPGLSANYNSNHFASNIFGLGKGWSLSELSVFNMKEQTLIDGFGETLELAKLTSENRFVAKKKSVFSDFFVKEGAKIVQYALDGNSWEFQERKGAPGMYKLHLAKNRFGRISKLDLDPFSGGDITYANGDILKSRLIRDGFQIWNNDAPSRKFATFRINRAGKLTKIEIGRDEQYVYLFTYYKNGLLESIFSSKNGSTNTTRFDYDDNKRLISERSNTGFKTVAYNDDERVVIQKVITGETIEERFDSEKRIVERKIYMGDKKNQPVENSIYEYDDTGNLYLTTDLSGLTTTYEYTPGTDLVTVATTKDKEGNVFARSVYTRNAEPTLIETFVSYNQYGHITRDIKTTYTNSYPFLPTLVENALEQITSVYSYNGSETTAENYMKGVHVSTDVSEYGLLKKRTNVLAAEQPTTQYEYDNRDRIVKIIKNGNETFIEYAGTDIKKIIGPKGDFVEKTVNSKGEVISQTTKTESGQLIKTRYQYEYHADKSKYRTIRTVTYPKRTVIFVSEYADNADGNVLLRQYVDNILIYERRV